MTRRKLEHAFEFSDYLHAKSAHFKARCLYMEKYIEIDA